MFYFSLQLLYGVCFATTNTERLTPVLPAVNTSFLCRQTVIQLSDLNDNLNGFTASVKFFNTKFHRNPFRVPTFDTYFPIHLSWTWQKGFTFTLFILCIIATVVSQTQLFYLTRSTQLHVSANYTPRLSYKQLKSNTDLYNKSPCQVKPRQSLPCHVGWLDVATCLFSNCTLKMRWN